MWQTGQALTNLLRPELGIYLCSILALWVPTERRAIKAALLSTDINRVIEMAWEDRTPFEAIEAHYGLDEAAVIEVMRRQLKPRSFRLWRKRVAGRKTKHRQLRGFEVGRFRCVTQRHR